MDDFDRTLPSDLLTSAIRTPAGTELVFPYPQIERAIHEATAHLIAVLGVEVFRILETGLGAENYSGYGFDDLRLDWTDYVKRNNQAVSRLAAENVHGAGTEVFVELPRTPGGGRSRNAAGTTKLYRSRPGVWRTLANCR